MAGVMLHGADYIRPPNISVFIGMQKIYNNTIFQKRSLPYYLIEKGIYEKQVLHKNNTNFELNFQKNYLGHCPERVFINNFLVGHIPLHFMYMKQGIMSIYKAFRYVLPVLPAKIVRMGLFLCNRFGERICKLPEVFRYERLRSEFINRTRFDQGRRPGFLSTEENDSLWAAKMFAYRMRALLDSDTVEVRLFMPDKDDISLHKIDKKSWPWYLVEAFNSLDNSIRKAFLSEHFETNLKRAVNTAHFHSDMSFKCEVCKHPISIKRSSGISIPLNYNHEDWVVNNVYEWTTKNQRVAGTQALISWFFVRKDEKLLLSTEYHVSQFYGLLERISLQEGFNNIIGGLLFSKEFREGIRKVIKFLAESIYD